MGRAGKTAGAEPEKDDQLSVIVDRDELSGLLALKASPLVRDLHAFQKRVLRLKGRWRGAIAGRRSGKSYLMAVWLLGGHAGQVSLYCARTLKSAKAILLPVFAELNARYDLGLVIRSVEGEVREPNGHVIAFHGLKDKSAADLLLGQKFRRIALDEGGAFDSELLQYCIEKVLQPTLFDVRGDMMIGGTPGPVPKGYFFDLVGDPRGTGKEGRWPTVSWDLRDNPHLSGDADENIAEILAANGWTAEHPTFRREVLAQWVDDAGSLIYHYKGARWAPVPAKGRTVLVVDFAGSDKPEADDCAFLVGRQDWDTRPNVHLLEGWRKHGINLAEIAALIRALKAKWSASKVIVDAGALGAGYAKTLSEVYNIDCEAADKRDKRARIERVIAALDTNTLHVCSEASQIVDEWLSLQWDAKRRSHHESCADDLSDACLYLMSEFSGVDQPSKVIDLRTKAERDEERLFKQAQRGRPSGTRLRAEPLIWLPEAA